MSLKGRITDDMKSAMKAGDKDRLKVVRQMLAAIKQVEIDKRIELDDAGILAVLEPTCPNRSARPNSRRSSTRRLRRPAPRACVTWGRSWLISAPKRPVGRTWAPSVPG
jgi:hypothetical protein